ncbi:hypothetical protein [Arenibaculum sp.]|jgi:hypothetical protein|uniref:hypothetical protein n=1 Tax=Arenibaculum sp. TaxID=2865862 RepID=UPI002E167DED|nr:hypothetical protein [Arenibaculum sp.]
MQRTDDHWAMVNLLTSRYGEGARTEASQRARAARAAGDDEAAEIWTGVLHALDRPAGRHARRLIPHPGLWTRDAGGRP